MANHNKRERPADKLKAKLESSAGKNAPTPDAKATEQGGGTDETASQNPPDKQTGKAPLPEKGDPAPPVPSVATNGFDDEDEGIEWGVREEEKKKTRTPPIHTDDEVRGMLVTIRAETKLTFLEIIKRALRAWHDKLAYMRPMYFRRLSRSSLRILSGLTANVETTIHETIIKLIRAKVNPAKIDEVIDELRDERAKFKELRQTISREAGIPITSDITTDINLAIGALRGKKQETTHQSVQNSYENIIQLLERYRLETFDAPKNPDDYE